MRRACLAIAVSWLWPDQQARLEGEASTSHQIVDLFLHRANVVGDIAEQIVHSRPDLQQLGCSQPAAHLDPGSAALRSRSRSRRRSI